MATHDGDRERRWPWWGQTRDVLSASAGFALLAIESVRGTYNATAMAMVAALLGITGFGVAGRALIRKWDREEERRSGPPPP